MSKKWFLWRALGTLVVLGLLASLVIVGGAALQRASWSQGYAAGQQAAGIEEGEAMPETLPYTHRGFGHPGRHYFHPGYFGIGWIVKIGMFFLLLVVIGKIFRWMIWGGVMMRGGPWAMGAHRHHHRRGRRGGYRRGRHGPVPPWCWDYAESSEEQAEQDQAEPDVETDDTRV